MKKLAIAIALASSATGVNAYDYRTGEELNVDPSTLPPIEKKTEVADTDVDVCEVSQSLATTVMKVRQQGVSMAKVYKIAKQDETGIMAKLTIAAYDMPRYSTASMQQRSITDFADKVYLTCVQSQ